MGLDTVSRLRYLVFQDSILRIRNVESLDTVSRLPIVSNIFLGFLTYLSVVAGLRRVGENNNVEESDQEFFLVAVQFGQDV